jgi:undecaprenyl-diphosphatase
VVEWFLMWVRRHGFVLFGVYRIVVAALLFTFGKHFMGF